GEGNGPLQSLPVETGVVLAGSDPFQVDMVMAQLMGFDYRKIPSLRHHKAFADPEWGNFSPDTLLIDNDNTVLCGLSALPVLREFLAPPGWASHIELGRSAWNGNDGGGSQTLAFHDWPARACQSITASFWPLNRFQYGISRNCERGGWRDFCCTRAPRFLSTADVSRQEKASCCVTFLC